MSTRSGKRIHGSFLENNIINDYEIVLKSERKTRSKRLKENCDENKCAKTKKRNNYVSHPIIDVNGKATVSGKSARENVCVSQKTTLKEQNLNISVHSDETDVDSGKYVRQTRRTKKFAENVETTLDNGVPVEDIKTKGKKKKSKKNNKKQVETDEVKINDEISKVSKKSKQKNKIVLNSNDISFNKGNGSIDSFHSAAGSPLKDKPELDNENLNITLTKSPRRTSKRYKPDSNNECVQSNDKFEKKSKKRKLSQYETEIKGPNANEDTVETLNTTFDKNPTKKRKSSIKNEQLEKSETPQKKMNSTYEKATPNQMNVSNNTECKSLRSSLAGQKQTNTEVLNDTYEKSKDSTHLVLDSTFDKETKLNTTYEKSDSNVTEVNRTFEKTDQNSDTDKKSSIVSFDSSTNLTYDKSDENSRISISDDSNSENIANTTPLLIESIIEESLISETSLKEKDTNNKKKESLTPPTEKLQPTVTPLKREGTFTKENTDLTMSPKSKLTPEGTPEKRTSLPTAGCTPFHISRSSRKEKSILNITHSIEKVERRSSVSGPPGRTTKVMFCSPINNPAVVAQQKRKVIKSNLKGSNKSFIFDESVSHGRPSTRKRSYTQNDADDARAKRKRLADRQQIAADRLSRPRTSSAIVKLSEPSTPSKRVVTPFKRSSPTKGKTDPKLSRTKLPNFAALHQKRFAKMESLDECQERKAKRAKQLLTPTGAVTVLERSSPKTRGVTTEQVKSTKEAEEKPETPKLPAPQTQKIGFTRFGFKLNKDTNPFNFTARTETKPKESRPNGLLTRQPSQPSLTGGTSMRREAAKQTVMREKSFTSLSERRSVTRKENRTMIKGVRTNRRFELQMMLRNING